MGTQILGLGIGNRLFMESVIYLMCNGATNSRHFRQFFCTRASNTTRTAKVHQKLPSTLGADTGNFFKFALVALLTPTGSMSCYRKPMRLVANMLQQVPSFGAPIDDYFRFAKKRNVPRRNTLNTLCNPRFSPIRPAVPEAQPRHAVPVLSRRQ